jgi:hypothetical protein
MNVWIGLGVVALVTVAMPAFAQSAKREARSTVMPLGGTGGGPISDFQVNCGKANVGDEDDESKNKCTVTVDVVQESAEACGWKIVLVGADVIHAHKKQNVVWKIAADKTKAFFRAGDGIKIDANDSGEADKEYYKCKLGSGNAIKEVSCRRAHNGSNAQSKKNRSRAFSYTVNLLVDGKACSLDPIIVSRD